MTRGTTVASLALGALFLALACANGPSPGDAPSPGVDGSSRPAPAEPAPPAQPPEQTDGTVQLHPTLLGDQPYPNDAPYPAWKAFDGKLGSTWVVGDKPLIVYLPPGRVERVELVPGFALDARRWAKNRRPSRVRVRLHTAGERRESVPGTWQEFGVFPPDALSDNPWVSLRLDQSPEDAIALELEVLEATPAPPGGDEDICISEIRILGTPERRQTPTGAWNYAFTDPWIDPIRDFSDHLEASYTRFDIEACELTHDGTGGMPLWRWEGTCTPTDAGLHIEGRHVGACFGAEPGAHLMGCDPTDTSENRDIDRVLPFAQVGPCFALIEGHPYRREGC